jgi:hypothetical protein
LARQLHTVKRDNWTDDFERYFEQRVRDGRERPERRGHRPITVDWTPM